LKLESGLLLFGVRDIVEAGRKPRTGLKHPWDDLLGAGDRVSRQGENPERD
jgi:hypothetical protein